MNPQVLIAAILSLVMLATRFGHFGSAWSLPDASWAIFFVGGFYLSRQWRWALPSLALLAVGIDLTVIHYFGVNNYCLTAAYAFNLPAYAVLWLGGLWLHRQMTGALSDALRLALSAIAALSVCFVITNGSFYWLGGRVREASMAGWVENFSDWYLSYLSTALLYVAIGAVVHVVVTSRTGVARAWRSN
jgi:hypothetical protein